MITPSGARLFALSLISDLALASLVFTDSQETIPAYVTAYAGKQGEFDPTEQTIGPLHPHLEPPDAFNACIDPVGETTLGAVLFYNDGMECNRETVALPNVLAAGAPYAIELFGASTSEQGLKGDDFYNYYVYSPSRFEVMTLLRVRRGDARDALEALGCTGAPSNPPTDCTFRSGQRRNATATIAWNEDPWKAMFTSPFFWLIDGLYQGGVNAWILGHILYVLSPIREVPAGEPPVQGLQKLLLLTIAAKALVYLVASLLWWLNRVAVAWVSRMAINCMQVIVAPRPCSIDSAKLLDNHHASKSSRTCRSGMNYVLTISSVFQLVVFWHTLTNNKLQPQQNRARANGRCCSIGVGRQTARWILQFTTAQLVFQLMCDSLFALDISGGVLFWIANTALLGIECMVLCIGTLWLGGRVIWTVLYASAPSQQGRVVARNSSSMSSQAFRSISMGSKKTSMTSMTSSQARDAKRRRDTARKILPLTRLVLLVAAALFITFITTAVIVMSPIMYTQSGFQATQAILVISNTTALVLLVQTISPYYVNRRRINRKRREEAEKNQSGQRSTAVSLSTMSFVSTSSAESSKEAKVISNQESTVDSTSSQSDGKEKSAADSEEKEISLVPMETKLPSPPVEERL